MTAHISRFFRPLAFIMACLVFCSPVVPVLAQQSEMLAPAAPSLTAPAETLLPDPAPLPAPEALPAPAPAENIPATRDLDLGSGAQRSAPSGAPDPEDIPEILMQEMREIELSCRANYFYSSFHDCRCIAVKFLDARIRNEPSMSRDTIFKSVASECPDEVALTGFVYRSCYDFMKFHRPYDYREFCACTARQMAEKYTERPYVNLRYMERLRKDAFLACGLADAPEWRAIDP